MSNPFLGITYSEFDNIVGPRLLFQYPDNIISSETFENINDFVIVGSHLNGKIIGINIGDIHYMNCSVAIDNQKVRFYSFLN